jgi:sodium/hydrogen antiporter
VFAAGIAFRRHEFEHEINTRIHHGAEIAGRLLELAVLLLLGSMLTTTGLAVPGLAGWLLAPLLILVVRPALVLAVTGRRFLDIRGRLFPGFFGVRGVAALYYATIVVASGNLSYAHTKASRVEVEDGQDFLNLGGSALAASVPRGAAQAAATTSIGDR